LVHKFLIRNKWSSSFCRTFGNKEKRLASLTPGLLYFNLFSVRKSVFFIDLKLPIHQKRGQRQGNHDWRIEAKALVVQLSLFSNQSAIVLTAALLTSIEREAQKDCHHVLLIYFSQLFLFANNALCKKKARAFVPGRYFYTTAVAIFTTLHFLRDLRMGPIS